jgi:hypothetical protein
MWFAGGVAFTFANIDAATSIGDRGTNKGSEVTI